MGQKFSGAGTTPFRGSRVTHNANQSIANNTLTALAFNTERFDTDGHHDVSTNNNRLTAPRDGYYLIWFNFRWSPNSTGIREGLIRINAGTLLGQHRLDAGATDHIISLAIVQRLVTNDYVEHLVLQTSGGALNVETTADRSPEFGMTWLGN